MGTWTGRRATRILCTAGSLVLFPPLSGGKAHAESASEGAPPVIGGSSSDVRKAAKGYYDSANTVKNYKKTWGQGNIHFGYFPDKSDEDLIAFDSIDGASASEVFADAAVLLTHRVADFGEMGPDSVVLDLGCGFGKPLMDLAAYANIKKGVGLDLATKHVTEATQFAAEWYPSLNLEFVEGSFTELPSALRQGTFTHVTSNVAFCHLHEKLPEILKEAYAALKPGGVLAAVDYLGPDADAATGESREPDALTKEHVWKRLKFRQLKGHTLYKKALVDAGFEIEHYEELDKHMCYGYALLAAAARQHGLVSEDGAALADNYDMTVKACSELKDLGMNLYKVRKPLHRAEL
eukprot:gene128-331_t